jgi:hypothetical protein
MSVGPYDDLTAYAKAAEIWARLETLRIVSGRRRIGDELRTLERLAEGALGRGHGITLECARSRIVDEAQTFPVSRTLEELRALRVRSRDGAAAGHPVLRAIDSSMARFERLAGDPDWEQRYVRIVEERTRDFGEESVKASVARANLAVALRGAGENLAYPDSHRERYLRRSFDLARDEWAFRREKFGKENTFTWLAAAIYVRSALSAHHSGSPLLSPINLVAEAADVVQARQRLHGGTHRSTVMSRIMHAEALALTGQARRAVWRLHVVSAEADDTGLDEPHMLPTALAVAHLHHGTREAVHQAEHYRAEALTMIDEAFGPSSPQALWLEHVLRGRQVLTGPS